MPLNSLVFYLFATLVCLKTMRLQAWGVDVINILHVISSVLNLNLLRVLYGKWCRCVFCVVTEHKPSQWDLTSDLTFQHFTLRAIFCVEES